MVLHDHVCCVSSAFHVLPVRVFALHDHVRCVSFTFRGFREVSVLHDYVRCVSLAFLCAFS